MKRWIASFYLKVSLRHRLPGASSFLIEIWMSESTVSMNSEADVVKTCLLSPKYAHMITFKELIVSMNPCTAAPQFCRLEMYNVSYFVYLTSFSIERAFRASPIYGRFNEPFSLKLKRFTPRHENLSMQV